MIPKETVDRILDTAQIEEVIGEFVELKKSGQGLKALSPFSSEKTPSFYVVPHKGIFKDFSSGKGGSVVTFLMEHEKMSYPEALRWLARKYNIEVSEEQSPEQEAHQNEREALLIALKYAADFYRSYLLNSHEGKTIGQPYLQERGIETQTAEAFELGLSPDQHDAFYRQALRDGYQPERLEEAGLIKKNEQDTYRDVFRNRLLFPIQNASGKVLGFGGRILRNNTKAPKYLNTPETPVYHKSDVLYGLHQARQSMRRQDRCILVEGYTDVLALHQCGLDYAVAASGTSLTEGQVKLIGRFTHRVLLLFDGDAAGTRAALRGMDLLLAAEMEVRIVVLPEGEDPDSFVKGRDAETVNAYLDQHEKDFLYFKTRLLLAQYGEDPVQKAHVVREVTESLSKLPDSVTRALYVKECARLLQLEERILYLELNKHLQEEVKKARRRIEQEAPSNFDKAGPDAPAPQPVEAPRPPGEIQEKQLAWILIHYGHRPYTEKWAALEPEERNQAPMLAEYLIKEFTDLEWVHKGAKAVFEEYRRIWSAGGFPELKDFLAHPNHAIAETATSLSIEIFSANPKWAEKIGHQPVAPGQIHQKEVDSTIRHLILRKLKQQFQEANQALKEAQDDTEVNEWLEVLQFINQQQKAIADKHGIVTI